MRLLCHVMENSHLNAEQQKKYDEMKKMYLKKSKSTPVEKQPMADSQSTPVEKQPMTDSHSKIINSLENQLKEKHVILKQLASDDLFNELNDKKKDLDDSIISKKQHIQDLRLNLQIAQKEIMDTVQEIKARTVEKTNELHTTNSQLSELSAEEKELVEKIHDAQKLRASQEKELEDIRLERLNIVNKNKDTQKIHEEILQYRNRLNQINSDRSMLELEIKSQMNLLEEERKKEHEIIARIIQQNKN